MNTPNQDFDSLHEDIKDRVLAFMNGGYTLEDISQFLKDSGIELDDDTVKNWYEAYKPRIIKPGTKTKPS